MRALFPIICLLVLFLPQSVAAESFRYSLSVYGAQMTNNHFEHFLTGKKVETRASYLMAVALAQRLGGWRDQLSYEVEGQLVKHFDLQTHWEFNLLGVLRWEQFPWDRWLDSSVAFGIGPSWATEKPQIELDNDGTTAQLLVYWMLELAIVPVTSQPQIELFSRIHHRSDVFGLVAEDGGSNALALGVKYRF